MPLPGWETLVPATAPRTPGRAGAPCGPLCRPLLAASRARAAALGPSPSGGQLQEAGRSLRGLATAARRRPRRPRADPSADAARGRAARRRRGSVTSRPRPRGGRLPPGRGCVLTPHAGAGPRVWCPGVGCRRLSRVELSRRQVSARCRRPGSEWRLRSHREGDESLGRGRGRHVLVVADPAVTGSEAGWSGTDRGRWAGRGSDGRAWQPMARRAPPGGWRLAGAGARGGRAGRCAAHHWLWRRGAGCAADVREGVPPPG